MSVLVVLEQRGGKWHRVSFEALTAARQIAQSVGLPVEAAVLGNDIGSAVYHAASYGVSKVFSLQNPCLTEYTPEGYTLALEKVIRQQSPQYVVFPHTYQVRDYAPKLSARFGSALLSDVVAVKSDGGKIVFVRQLFGGKLNADLQNAKEPAFVSVQAGAFRAAEPEDAGSPVETVTLDLAPEQILSKPETPFQETQRSVDLGAATMIVSVGRGIKEKDNLTLIEDLASVLGAEVAASRPICDNGWLPMERQVGSSGQTVSPKVYFAIGISGAIQHLVGMKGSKTIVAVNKDESAPIFESADYGIVGDLFEVVPALVEELKKAKS